MRFKNLECKLLSLQSEVVVLHREITCLSQPPVYVDYMELEEEVRDLETINMVVDNRDSQADVKEELTPTNLGKEGFMVTQSAPGSN